MREDGGEKAFEDCILGPVLVERGQKAEKKKSQRSDEGDLGRSQRAFLIHLLWLEENKTKQT